jgi:hypothetical protein
MRFGMESMIKGSPPPPPPYDHTLQSQLPTQTTYILSARAQGNPKGTVGVPKEPTQATYLRKGRPKGSHTQGKFNQCGRAAPSWTQVKLKIQ